MVEGDIESWLSTDAAWLGANTDRIWTESLISFDEKVEARIDEHLKKIERFTEWHFHRHFEKQIGRSSNLFLGNSMPIRDFNSVFPKTAKRMRIFCNRGLSGIDGLIASAAGVAFGTRRETHAILGDLSTIHDLSSLSLISELREKINLTLWVINNGGGEIFRMVPTAHSGAPQEWFTTPQSIDLSGIAKGFRLSYSRVHSLSTLETLVPETFSEEGIRLIEVLIDSADNTRARKTFRYE